MDTHTPFEEREVLAWLQKNPDFFSQYPELLPAAIHASGKVLSLEAGQLNLLRRQNDQLREKLDSILERIRRNEEIYRAFHTIQIQMITAPNPQALLVAVTEQPEKLFDIQRVSVVLSDSETDLNQLFDNDKQTEEENRLFVLDHSTLARNLGSSGLPTIRIGREGENRHLFFGKSARNIRSEALVPLYRPRSDDRQPLQLIGSLNLGGSTPSRFLPSQATDLLQDLADVLSLCLVRMVQSGP